LTEKRKINAIFSQNLKSILNLLLVWKQGSFKVQRENPSGKKLTCQRQIDGLEDGVKQCMQVVEEIDWNQREHQGGAVKPASECLTNVEG
jgi:hypothetical protein